METIISWITTVPKGTILLIAYSQADTHLLYSFAKENGLSEKHFFCTSQIVHCKYITRKNGLKLPSCRQYVDTM